MSSNCVVPCALDLGSETYQELQRYPFLLGGFKSRLQNKVLQGDRFDTLKIFQDGASIFLYRAPSFVLLRPAFCSLHRNALSELIINKVTHDTGSFSSRSGLFRHRAAVSSLFYNGDLRVPTTCTAALSTSKNEKDEDLRRGMSLIMKFFADTGRTRRHPVRLLGCPGVR